MEPGEKWFVRGLFGLFGLILVLMIVQNSNQNNRLTVMEVFGDVTDANKEYLTKFGEQVQKVSGQWFVSKQVYGDDMAKNTERFQQIENRLNLLSSVPRQRQAGVNPQTSQGVAGGVASGSASVPAATTPQTSVPASIVPTPNAASIAGVPQPTVLPPSVAATNPAVVQSPTAVAPQAPQPSDPATGGALTPQIPPQPSAVTTGNCDCNDLKEQLDQANQKLDQVHERLGNLPDKYWQAEENRRVMDDLKNFFKPQTPSSGSFLNAPPPPVESKPTITPQRQSGPRVQKNQPVSLPNVNLAQPAQPRLHEVFLEQWAYNGTCYQKFVLKDGQGKIYGQPFSRPIGQQMAYRLW